MKLSAFLRSQRDAARTSAVVPYGAVRFAEGRLTDSAGSPIAGAVLDVKSRVQRPGARYSATSTVTDRRGRAVRVPDRARSQPDRSLRVQGLFPRPGAGPDRFGLARRQSRDQAQAHAPARPQRAEDPLRRPAQGRPRSEGHARDDRCAGARCSASRADRQRQGRREGPLPVRLSVPPHAREGALPLPGAADAAARLPLQGCDVAAGVGGRLALTVRPHRAERLDHDRVELRAAQRRSSASAAAGRHGGRVGARRRSSRRRRRSRRPRVTPSGISCSARRSG